MSEPTFKDRLTNNQREHAKNALLKTVCEDAEQNLGEIWEALEKDDDGDYIMFDVFKTVTIGELVSAAIEHIPGIIPDGPIPVASAPEADEDDEEEDFEDDDSEVEDEDDDFDDDDDDEVVADDEEEEEEEEEEAPPKKSKKKKKKKSSKKKGKKKSKKSSKKGDKDEPLEFENDAAWKAYKKAIIACMKEAKARTEDKALLNKQIREAVGGIAKQVRDACNELIEEKRLEYTGQARGTRYYLA